MENSNQHSPDNLQDGIPIYVTRPFLPPLEELIPYLDNIWDSRIVTNRGAYHLQLEAELCKHLGVNYISLCSSGTVGLLTALRFLKIEGEVITTPYSFVATAHSLLWSGITPVFVDVDPTSLNIDPKKIEQSITSNTSAILAVHCYGTPCDVDKIEVIASKYGLKVIYDAAHAFGVDCHCGSVLNHGDLSILSFHATKVFNTLEGGAIISSDLESKLCIDKLLNFGFEDETSVSSLGINGKMSEVNAALGLLQLKYIEELIDKRSLIDKLYRQLILPVKGISCLRTSNILTENFSYFPIFVEADYSLSRDELCDKLKDHGFHVRKYFYPLITSFPMYSKYSSAGIARHPVASEAAQRVLCLPIYPELPSSIVCSLCDLMAEFNQGI